MPVVHHRILIAIHWYSESLHEGILRHCVEHGGEAVLLTTDTVERYRGQRFDGIVSGLPDETHPMHRFVAESGLPVVELSHSYPEQTEWCRYPSDSKIAGRLAADYLRRRPVVSFAYAAYYDNATGTIRESHFRAFLNEEHDRRPIATHTFRGPARDEPEEEAKRRLATFLLGLPRPAGIFAAVDEMARVIVDVARDAGLRVPGDLYVMGFGDRPLETAFAPVPTTTIALDYAAWGYAAAGMLDDLIAGRIRPGTIRHFAPGGIVERASTGGEAGGDPLCDRALALMRNHQQEPLDIAGLARALDVSSSTLKRTFAAVYGTGVAERYLALRIETAKGLLAGGDKVDAVALAVGFGSARSLRKAFLKVTGVTPGGFSPGQ